MRPREPAPGNPIRLFSNFFAAPRRRRTIVAAIPDFASSQEETRVQRVGEGRGRSCFAPECVRSLSGSRWWPWRLSSSRQGRTRLVRPATDRRRSAWVFRSYQKWRLNSPAYLTPVSLQIPDDAGVRVAGLERETVGAGTLGGARLLRGAIFLQGAFRIVRRAFRRCGQVDPARRSHRREDRTGSAATCDRCGNGAADFRA